MQQRWTVQCRHCVILQVGVDTRRRSLCQCRVPCFIIIIIITTVTMAQNAAAETDGDGGVSETKDDVEYEDANNHDEKKTSLKTSVLTKFDQTRNFFWDPSTKQVLGRTGVSWGTFYTIVIVNCCYFCHLKLLHLNCNSFQSS